MATKYFCDRCDFKTEKVEDIFHFNYPVLTDRFYGHDLSDIITKKVDICLSCIRQLNDWVKPLPKEGK